MAGPLSKLVRSPDAKRRLRVVFLALLCLTAVLSWWSIIEGGISAARMITALASSSAVVVQAVMPGKRRERGRGPE